MSIMHMQRAVAVVVSCTLGGAAGGCDMKIVGNDETALFNLSAGPQAGKVTSLDREGSEVSVEELLAEDAATAALDRVNEVRASLGLPPMKHNSSLTRSAISHAGYLAANHLRIETEGLSPHVEEEALVGFTGESFVDRDTAAGFDLATWAPTGEVIAYKASATAATEAWLESLYHRLPMIRADVTEFGYGEASAPEYFANVVEMGRRIDAEGPATTLDFVAFPPAGAQDVPYLWKGLESPLPQPPPQGYPSGPVITLSATRGDLANVAALVLAGPVGGLQEPLDATVLTQANDSWLGPKDVSVIPYLPLMPHTTYEVMITGTVDDFPFAERWSFTTRGEGCTVSGQGGDGECGAGRGCYPLNGDLVCLWEGTATTEDACTYVNDCAPGLTCMGSRCSPVCDSTGSTGDLALSCDIMCEGNAIAPFPDAEYAICRNNGCAQDASACNDGEACYWVGSLMCAWAGELQRGETCDYANDCAAGLTCFQTGAGEASCHALCGGPNMPGCDVMCTDTTAWPVDQEAGISACL